MSLGRGRDREPEQEPVTITDKRRIDPSTGEPRPSTGFAGGSATTPGGSATTPGREPAPHDAEPGLAEEAGLTGEVLDAEGADEAGTSPDPVAQELLERTADLQRLSAEYANYRRRVERDRQAVVDAAKASVAGQLLGVLDDLDRARSHGDLEGPLKSVADKLAAALADQGLTAYGAVGDRFDPSLHEAVSHEGSGGEPRVALVMRPGYRFGERVLRPAMVGVTEDPAEGGDAPAGPGGGTVPGPGAPAAPEQD